MNRRNIQQPTSNAQHPMALELDTHWMLDVHLIQRFNERILREILLRGRGIYAASTSVWQAARKRHKCRAPVQGPELFS